MTGRINIPALRERRASASEPYVLRPEERDALVEAVEAAQRCVADDFREDTAYDRLCDALARFDFGEETT